MTSQTANPANNNYSCLRTNIDYFSIACKAARRWGKRIADASPADQVREPKSAIFIGGCAPGRVSQQAFTRKEHAQKAILHRASKEDKLTGNTRRAIEPLGVLRSSKPLCIERKKGDYYAQEYAHFPGAVRVRSFRLRGIKEEFDTSEGL